MTDTATTYLQDIISAQLGGRAVGIMSVCSANRFVIEAAMHQAAADETILLVESTANQVNQFGGYTGMTPKKFATLVMDIARGMGFPEKRILLGGDHTGPGPWQSEPAGKAMDHAMDLVQACIDAGYGKIHLDASTACLDDVLPNGCRLPVEVTARRSALLCRAAETAAANATTPPLYVIGTDVPHPGGMRGDENHAWISRASDVTCTINKTRKCFDGEGLEAAWDRTVAVVVQAGVDFGPETVMAYDPKRAEKLAALIKSGGKFVFEAHATDYQSPSALHRLVADRFAILKVGPALTFAFREALTALEHIETELFSGHRGIQLSNLRQTVEHAMDGDPSPWSPYHPGKDVTSSTLRYHSYSDRVRYFWSLPELREAIKRLLKNLSTHSIPLPLISQYLPRQYEAIREGRFQPRPDALIRSRIMDVTARYAEACGKLGMGGQEEQRL
jgi:D-tagatose-1,6-bisphosphate aldolase subunit GatZ/KbaZ